MSVYTIYYHYCQVEIIEQSLIEYDFYCIQLNKTPELHSF